MTSIGADRQRPLPRPPRFAGRESDKRDWSRKVGSPNSDVVTSSPRHFVTRLRRLPPSSHLILILRIICFFAVFIFFVGFFAAVGAEPPALDLGFDCHAG